MNENEKYRTDTQSAIERVVANFLKGLPDRMDAITTAYDENDWGSLRSLTHKLAGAAIFGYPQLGAAAHEVEKCVDKGNYDRLFSLIRQLRDTAGRIQAGEIIANPLDLLR